MVKILFRHFMESNWAIKLVVLVAWVSALIMVIALFLPYYHAIVAAASN